MAAASDVPRPGFGAGAEGAVFGAKKGPFLKKNALFWPKKGKK
jgi:hypothetical protein